MNIDSLMINIIIILFPILVNILHSIYIKNTEKEENDLFFDIALISSLYLFTTLNQSTICFLVVSNIIFLIALLKKRIFTSIIAVLCILINYEVNGVSNILLIFIEYIMYYVFYIVFMKQRKEKIFIKLFLLVKIVFIYLFYINNDFEKVFINATLISIIFTLLAYFIVYLVNISEDIVNLHINLKEFEKEKQIRDSLFKITHEIKNPVAVCKSYLDMFDFNNPDHERYIPILKDEMKKILLLLQDFSSMGKIQITPEILDINLLLEEVARQYEPIMSKDNIQFITEIDDEEFYLEGDYNRLSQVLTNIIKNAKEARDNTKKSFISLKTKIKKNKFIMIIEDNGIGMSKEDIKRVDEPFFTTKENGTGLGVALSCEIIKAHNGKIEFSSKEGIGTKVVITLPFKRIEF